MKTSILSVLLSVLISAVVWAGDATGNWSGSLEAKSPNGETRNASAYLVLKQEGEKLTGSGGPDAQQQHPIRNGKVDGERVTFEIEAEGGVMKFDFKLDGDELSGQGVMERDGQVRSAVFNFKRVKS
ncbi:MAG: hypothetical protein HY235_23975 [Acidobacteria bacterium]|nr:hypothetical protein [Acidobacteriota bacterium]